MVTPGSSGVPIQPSFAGIWKNKYDVDFERGLSVEQRAIGWMVEDHLYWALVDVRWSDDANFAKGPRNFSKKSLPPCVRS